MYFSMRGQEIASRREEEGGIVVFVRRGNVFWYAASEKVGFAFGREGGEGVIGGRVGL